MALSPSGRWMRDLPRARNSAGRFYPRSRIYSSHWRGGRRGICILGLRPGTVAPFSGSKSVMLLKGVGLDSLGASIESNLACARYLESMVQASDDFEMVAPVELSIFCFRHVSAQLRNGSPAAIDAFNERLLIALQRDGSSYLSNATLGGRFALRGCVLNYRTTLCDMEILLDDLRRVGRSLPTPN